MADKGPPHPAKPGEENKDEKKEGDQLKVQPKDEVGTRKGCRRYRWELNDSNKEFWVLGHGPVKFLSLGCLIAALFLFWSTFSVHPILTLIITMEISIFCFFILLYTFALHRYMPFILWPVADLLNDLFICVFLGGGIYFAVQKQPEMPVNYLIAVVLMGVAAFFAFLDIYFQRKHFKGKRIKRNILVPPQPDKSAAAQGEKTPGKEPEKPGDKGKPADKAAADKGKEKDKAPPKGKK
ncbi:CKLF-like MARVEL transmembrane domain-containing protein 2 [Fukomys damarensis]|uniref:CKLF-like MARVEL transmembrane domain-containing protein 2 n=1 Tax=Fukomys damarensis TaxID=885580 RepID=A0A091CM94_FUKDA|nr:CKLF-like MARVEL transmembrane domain-containing protein 2 [Fukomys damarensis]KFO19954.1 CKLF-like MARVEL transmembrane domain-containing protein 2 [Fukomys damarensis]